MARNIVDTLLTFHTDNLSTVKRDVESLRASLGGLAKTNATLAMTTGKFMPQTAQQLLALKALATQGNATAQSYYALSQGTNKFAQVFGTTSKASMQAMFKNKAAYMQTSAAIRSEMNNLGVVANATTGELVNFSTIPGAKFRVMGNLYTQWSAKMAASMVTLGKQAQWVGRQMMVGITLPALILGKTVINTTLELNRQQTELRKYYAQAGVIGQDFTDLLNEQLAPAFENLSEQMAIHQADIVQVASLWAAAGHTAPELLVPLTELTTQLAAITQGDLDLTSSYELVRSIMATYAVEGESAAAAIERVRGELEKLQLIQSTTAITFQELGEALPVVSSSAKLLGISASEVAAILTGMREKGVQAGQAANALKFGLVRLAAPTKNAEEAFAGLTAQLDNFKYKSIEAMMFTQVGAPRGIKALEDLAALVGALDASSAAKLLEDLFGSRQVDRMTKALEAMRSSTSDYASAMEAASDATAAHEVFQQQLDIVLRSMNKQWDRMRVQLENAAAALGKLVLPYAKQLFQWLVRIVEGFNKMSDSSKKMIVGLVAIAAALGPITFAFGMLHLAVGRFLQIFKVAPLKLLFGMKVAEDPFGLAALARSTNNPALRILAGWPAMNQRIVASEAEKATAIDLVTAALVAEAGSVETLNAAWMRMNATQFLSGQGAALPLAIGEKQLTSLRGAVSFPKYTGMTTKYVQDFFAQAMFSGQVDLQQAMSLGLAKQLNGASFVIPGVKGSQSLESLKTYFATMFGLALTDESIERVIGKATAVAVDGGIAAATTDQSFLTKAKATLNKMYQSLFGTINARVITPPAGGTQASMLLMRFKSFLPEILILTAAIAALGANWKDLWEGMSLYVTKARDIILEAVGGLAKSIVNIFSGSDDKVSDNAEAFKELGSMIGRVAVSISKFVAKIIDLIGPTLSVAIKAATEGFKALVAVLTFNWGEKISPLGALAGTLLGLMVATKVAAAFKALSATITFMNTLITAGVSRWTAFKIAQGVAAAQSLLMKGSIDAATVAIERQTLAATAAASADEALAASAVEAATASGALAMVNPAVAIAVGIGVAITAITAFTAKADTMGEVLAEHAASIKDSFESIARTVSGIEVDTFKDSMISGMNEIMNVMEEFYNKSTELQGGIMGWAKWVLNIDVPNYADITKEMIQTAQEQMDILKATMTGMDMPHLKAAIAGVKEEIEGLGAVIEANKRAGKDTVVEEEQLKLLQEFLSWLRSGETYTTAFNQKLAGIAEALRVLAGGNNKSLWAKRGSEEGQAYADALENQLSQLEGRVTDVLVQQMQQQHQAALDSFDAMVERRLSGIDAQIDAIEKINDKEEWLQQQREYRQRREELLRQLSLNQAISQVEKLKAIHEGRYDDARLIELQSAADAKKTRDDIDQLDRDHEQTLRERRRQQRIDALNEQKSLMQKQFALQRKAMERQFEMQETLFQNLLDELTEFAPKNKKQWEKMYADLLDLAKDHGVNIKGAARAFTREYGMTIREGLRDAEHDAERDVLLNADNLSKAARNAIRANMVGTVSPADSHFFNVLAEYAEASTHDMTKEEVAAWIKKISNALEGVSPAAIRRAEHMGMPVPVAHEGGLIGGRGMRDIPIIAQEGEFVLNRKSAAALGTDTLKRLNSINKYHTGGIVGDTFSNIFSTETLTKVAEKTIPYQVVGPVIGKIFSKAVNSAAIGLGVQALSNLSGQSMAEYTGPLGQVAPAGVGKGRNGATLKSINYWNWANDLFGSTGFLGVGHSYIGSTGTYSQHAYGNAVDMFNTAAKMMDQFSATVKLAKELDIAHVIHAMKVWSYNRPYVHGYDVPPGGSTHYDHVHADFLPQYQGTPPGYPVPPYGLKTGGVVKFDTPAMIHAGETVVPENISKALSRAADQAVVNINIEFDGNLIGDEASYRRLVERLDGVGRRIAKERGYNDIVVKPS